MKIQRKSHKVKSIGRTLEKEVRPISVSKPIIDENEFVELQRTSRQHLLCKQLGIKLPSSIAKKFYCRCGAYFFLPKEVLQHKRTCEVLLKDKKLIDRANAVIDKIKEAEVKPVPKERETFECRCGHIFTNKKIYNRHQKKCSVISEAFSVIEKGKDYLARHKKKEVTNGRTKKTKKFRDSKSKRIQRR